MSVTFCDLSTIQKVRRLRAERETQPDWDPVETASRAKAYDPEAFATLFDVFFEKIRRFAYFHTGDAHLADDLASEVFSQALDSIDKFDDRGGTIGPWLFGIARNVLASHWRAGGPQTMVPLDGALALAAPERECPESVAIENITHEELYEALSRLGDEHRTIIILRFIEGYDTKSVASVLGKRPGAVRTQQHRAMKALRVLLEERSMQEEVDDEPARKPRAM